MVKNKPTWKNRRRVIFTTLLFCAGIWIFILLAPTFGITVIPKIAEVMITISGFLAGSVIGGYVFGATWESVGMSKKR